MDEHDYVYQLRPLIVPAVLFLILYPFVIGGVHFFSSLPSIELRVLIGIYIVAVLGILFLWIIGKSKHVQIKEGQIIFQSLLGTHTLEPQDIRRVAFYFDGSAFAGLNQQGTVIAALHEGGGIVVGHTGDDIVGRGNVRNGLIDRNFAGAGEGSRAQTKAQELQEIAAVGFPFTIGLVNIFYGKLFFRTLQKRLFAHQIVGAYPNTVIVMHDVSYELWVMSYACVWGTQHNLPTLFMLA